MYCGEMLSGCHLCGEARSSSVVNGNAMQGRGLHRNELEDGETYVGQRVCSRFNWCAMKVVSKWSSSRSNIYLIAEVEGKHVPEERTV